MKKQEQIGLTIKKLSKLRVQRDELEEKLLKKRCMIQACLVKRFLGTRERKRKKPYWYLSRAIEGKTILSYVRISDLIEVKKKAGTWKEFSSTLAQWVKVTQRLERLLRHAGEAQSEEYNPAGKS